MPLGTEKKKNYMQGFFLLSLYGALFSNEILLKKENWKF